MFCAGRVFIHFSILAINSREMGLFFSLTVMLTLELPTLSSLCLPTKAKCVLLEETIPSHSPLWHLGTTNRIFYSRSAEGKHMMKFCNLLYLRFHCNHHFIRYSYNISRQHGLVGKGVVFTTTLLVWSEFNLHRCHVVAFLNNDDYLSLVASSKQHLVDKNSKKFTGTFDHWKLLSRCGFLRPRRYRTSSLFSFDFRGHAGGEPLY